MAEVAEVRGTNGLKVVSTFSGAGGSCLGFEMAGYDVVWSSEFVEAAAIVHEVNFPHTPVDRRDIRDVDPSEILDSIGMKVGQVDVLNGSPPCASFSISGKRDKAWGEVKKYSETKQRTDDLFFEFARILEGLKPRTFVAENVAGLASGRARGYFRQIMECLKRSGYRVGAKILDAQWLGVPQTRRRLIFVGVREDFSDLEPPFPSPLPYRYSLRDAISLDGEGVVSYRGAVREGKSIKNPKWGVRIRSIDEPSPVVMAQGMGTGRPDQTEIVTGASIEKYAIGKEWAGLRPGQGSDKYINLIKAHPDRPSPTVTQTAGNPGAAGVVHPFEKRKFSIGELKRICAFPDDFELSGTYSQQWERLGRAVPPMMMFHVANALAKVF